ncbi:conserved domain protein [Leuconostoc inhae]|uniref:Conserved domain protein n=1 Tax=Leuconostoc inhae TaxID=178001 RepID=A0AAN2QV21_9LACO|nr:MULTISPECIES: phage tail tip lysozyme [Leuconostoc]MBZ5983293.1 CHAP domain-containing protein [Leuconostoc gasicomitatum]CUW08349.1 conserved domain protein [Leuconostoc inhae]CUW17068.1 conserved domain protein [Leuconostoc inhae]
MTDDKNNKLKKSFEARKVVRSAVKAQVVQNRFLKPREARINSKTVFKSAKKELQSAKQLHQSTTVSQKQLVAKVSRKQHRLVRKPSQKVVTLKKRLNSAQRLEAAKQKQKIAKKVLKKATQNDPTLLKNKSKRAIKGQTKYEARKQVEKALGQDDTLAEGIALTHKYRQAKQTYHFGKSTGKVTFKAGKGLYGVGNRLYNFTRGRGFQRTPKALQLRTKLRRSIQKRLAASKNLTRTSNIFKGLFKFGTTHIKRKGGILAGVILVVAAVFLGGMMGGSMAIYQEERDLTDSWEHFSQIDAKHTDDDNQFYSNIDAVMFYMNYRFEDYQNGNIMNPLVYVGNYAGYMDSLWDHLNGKSDNYSLTTMKALMTKKGSGYHLSDDDYQEMTEIDDENGYQELPGQLDFPIQTDNLVVTRRFGYEHNQSKMALYKSMVAQVSDSQNILAPMSGKVAITNQDDQVILTDKHDARITLTGLKNLRVTNDQKISSKANLGEAKSTSLTIKYEKYDDDKKEWFVVNPAFYFPKVTYTQVTTLGSSDFDPSGDVSKRAQKVYDYLSKLGYKTEGIAAILGNWTVESSINPKRAEGDYLKPPVGASASSWDDENWLAMGGNDIYNGKYANILHRGLGYGQFTDTSDGGNRHTLLLNFSKQNSKKWYTSDLQLDFMLNGDNPGARTAVKAVLNGSAAKTVPDLTRYFLNNWEGNSNDKLQARTQAAMNWFNYFSNSNPDNGGGSGQEVYDKYKDKIKPVPTAKELKTGWAGNSYAPGNCTWYVYNREAQLGHQINGVMGNAADWVRNYTKTPGAAIVNQPQRGDAIVFTNGILDTSPLFGHVAVVEYVNSDGSFVISEMNYGGLYKTNWRVLKKQMGMHFIRFN